MWMAECVCIRSFDLAADRPDDKKPSTEKTKSGAVKEEELGAYLHLRITETEKPELDIEKVVPESVRQKRIWKRFHVQRQVFASRTTAFIRDGRKMFIVSVVLCLLALIGLYFDLDKGIIGGTLVIFGILSSAFSWLGAAVLSGIALIPFIGPILVTILSSSVLWIINGLGYFVSVVAIRAGHGKAVLNYRLLVIVFLTGMVSGYVIAKLVN